MNTDEPGAQSRNEKTRTHELICAKFGVQPSGCTAQAKGSRRNNFTFCCRTPGPLARRERRAIPRPYVRSEQQSQRACGPQPEGARRRAGICFVAAPRRCRTSTSSRRLASARPALAPKCEVISARALKDADERG